MLTVPCGTCTVSVAYHDMMLICVNMHIYVQLRMIRVDLTRLGRLRLVARVYDGVGHICDIWCICTPYPLRRGGHRKKTCSECIFRLVLS